MRKTLKYPTIPRHQQRSCVNPRRSNRSSAERRTYGKNYVKPAVRSRASYLEMCSVGFFYGTHAFPPFLYRTAAGSSLLLASVLTNGRSCPSSIRYSFYAIFKADGKGEKLLGQKSSQKSISAIDRANRSAFSFPSHDEHHPKKVVRSKYITH